MKRYHLKKMSDLLETLEIVSNNAKNKGHRSGFRCHQLAKELADQFAVFVPTLTTIITNKENKNNPSKISGNFAMSKGEYEIYKAIKSGVRVKVKDIYDFKLTKKSFNTIKQYVFILKKKGFVQSIKVIGKHYKYYKVNDLSFTTMDQNLINKLSSWLSFLNKIIINHLQDILEVVFLNLNLNSKRIFTNENRNIFNKTRIRQR